MRISHSLKVVLFAVPLILSGCSSSSSDDSVSSTNGNNYPYLSRNPGMSSGIRGATIEQLKQHNVVYFDFDRYDLMPQYAQALNYHADYLRSNPGMVVTIEGHADERGTPEYNIALGERRANAVKSYLQGRGVSGNQVSIVSYGKEKPAVLGHTESIYAQNRRAVIVY